MEVLDLKQNYFDLFNLSLSFEIDRNQLLERQQSLQAVYHPDRFVNASEQNKRLSVQQASWINEAYRTLENPVRRARYMLEISGLEMNDESETTSDTDFLMEQISYREEMEDLSAGSSSLECCDKLIEKLNGRAEEISQEFVTKFRSGDLNSARLVNRKMQFIQRIQDQVTDLQFELEDKLS